MHKLIFLLLFTLLTNSKVKGQVYIDTIGNTIVYVKTLVDSTHFQNTSPLFLGAWDLMWGPDNKLWFSNSDQIERYDPLTQTTKTLLDRGKGSILGIVAHRDFSTIPYIYAVVDTEGYYAATVNNLILCRYTYDALGDSLKDEQFLLSWYHVSEHTGGRVMFGQDGKIYVTTAEYNFYNDSLFFNSGKILRVNDDGTVPIDNSKQDYTYSYGHRNPQGIVQVPNGNIISSEYGDNNDELNLIKVNQNYGWFFGSTVCGGNMFCDGTYCPWAQNCPVDSAFWFPQLTFPMNVGENPPSGIDYYNHPAIPEFNGIIEAVTGVRFGNGYWSQGIIVYGLNSTMDSVTSKIRYLGSKIPGDAFSAFGRIRDVCTGPNGEVYFIGWDRSTKSSIYELYNPLYSNEVSEQNLNENISIYPNPTNGSFTIRINNFKNTEYEIVDNIGKTVMKGVLINTETKIDLQSNAAGIYLFKLKSEKAASYKILKVEH